MSALLHFKQLNENTYRVYYYNGVFLGELYREIDGFYVYEPNIKQGYWTAYAMREIADKLDELNKDWEEEINRYMEDTAGLAGN